MSIIQEFVKSLLIILLMTMRQYVAAQIQINKGNNNINIQSTGNNNIIIGRISYTTNKIINIKEARPDFALFKIVVNTKCKVYEDRKQMGISMVDLPLKLKLSKGVHRLHLQADYYNEYDLMIEVRVDAASIGLENYLDIKFSVIEDLYPIAESPNGRYGYINLQTKELAIPFQFSEAKQFRCQIAPACKNDACGFIDQFGDSKIDFKFALIGNFFINNRTRVWDGNRLARYYPFLQGHNGLIDTTGKFIIDPNKYNLDKINEQYAIFNDYEGNYGIIDLNGKELLKLHEPTNAHIIGSPPIEIDKYNNSYLVQYGVIDDRKYGLFDYRWNQLLPIKYDQIIYKRLPNLYKNKGVYIVNNGGKYQLLNANGDFVSEIHFPYDYIDGDLNDYLFRVKKGEKMGVVELNFNQVIPPHYDFIGIWRDLLIVDSADKRGFYNLSGKKILPFDYESDDNGLYFDLLVTRKGEKLGFINELGKEVSPFIYDEIMNTEVKKYDDIFHGYNYGKVRIGNKFGLINKVGTPITPVAFDETEGFLFSNHYAVVRQGKKFGLVNETGTITYFSQPFTNLEALPLNVYQATLPGRYVYFNRNLECIYGCTSQ